MSNRTYFKGRRKICRREKVEIPRYCSERFFNIAAPHMIPLREAGVKFAGTGILSGDYRITRHNPRWHSLIYTFSGCGVVRTERKEHLLHPGSLYVAPAHVPHEYFLTEAPWNIAWFCMDEKNGFHCNPETPLVLVSPFDRLVLSIIQQLTDDPERGTHSHPKIMNQCVQLLITILSHDTESTIETTKQKRQRRLELAFLRVHRNPNHKWSSREIITQGHLPYGIDRLRQLCVQLYGQTPMNRVRGIRMQIAQELLRATDYPLRIIAPMVGYKNEFAFSTAFRKQLGMAPQDFRKGTAS